MNDPKSHSDQLTYGLYQDRLHCLSRVMQAVVREFDFQGNTMWWSDTLNTVLGYTSTECSTSETEWMKEVHADDQDRVRNNYDDHLKLGSSQWTMEYRIRKAHGDYAYIRDSVFLFKTANGEPDHLIGIMQDITGQKHYQDDLKRIEETIRRHQLALLELANSQSIQSGNQTQAFSTITEISAKTCMIERVSIWCFNDDRTILRCDDLYEWGKQSHTSGIEVPASRYPCYFAALEAGLAIDAKNVQTDSRTKELWEPYCLPQGISSLLDVPIRMRGTVIGVVCHEHTGPNRNWTGEEIRFTQSVANFVSLALEAKERVRAEEALRDSEESYRLTIENALDAVVTMDIQGTISGWTHQAESMFGWSPHEAIGQPLVSLIVPPSFREAHNQGLEHYRATGEGPVLNKRLEITALHRQGHEFPVELTISPIHSQGRVTFSAFIRDITRRKETEEAIKNVAKFPDENPNPVLRVSENGQLLYANVASKPLLETWKTQVDHTVPDSVNQIVQAALTSGSIRELEVDCHQQICSLVVSPIVEERYVNMYGRNITERKKAELALYQAKETAELANRTKSEFLATMSHELRTPLTGILGYAQILKKETDIPQKQRNAVNVIEHSAEHLLSLINEILDLSRIEAGSLEIQLDQLNLAKLLVNLSNTMRARSDDKKLSFTYECLSDFPPLVMGDERRLRQVLINLLDNAIKYTKEGGIALKVGYHEERIRFLVEDTGMGIKPADLEAIFLSFQRVHDPKMGVEGTGLGLTISQKLVALMSGNLQVKSTLGEGSQFWFDLNLPEVKDSQEEFVAAEPKVIGIKGERPKILIVDDKIDNRMFLNDLLTPLGFDVTEAQDGEECLGQAMTIRPNVILMDLRMPNMNGLEATRLIRQSPELKDVIIIAISASSFEHNRQECLKAGTDNFLSKPFRINKLLELLHQYLPIELVYDTTSQDIPTPVASTSNTQRKDFRIPPPDLVETLLNLAKRGDIKNVLIHVEKLAMTPDYQEFSRKVESMAKGFQVTKLCEFLEEVRNTP